MNLNDTEKRFSSFLQKSWELSDIAPFLLAYIRLLLLFKHELSTVELNVILERQKQLRGEEFNHEGFDELKNASREEMGREFDGNDDSTRQAIFSRLVFCALLDTEENDFFYLTEPMFEFAQKTKVSPDRVQQILESEFTGFKI